jgi:hypothetical protein
MPNHCKKILWIASLLFPLSGMADQLASATVAEPSVEDNVRAMDKDHDGMVTVFEMRSLIEARHGKGYKKQTLDNMEASARGTSCTTPFAKPLY